MENELIFTYKKLHEKMLQIIKTSKSYIFLTSFNFDWNYDENLKNEIIKSLDRGVKVYIFLSSQFENKIDYTHPNLYVRLSNLYSKYNDKLFNMVIKAFTKIRNLPKIVLHMRFIYNGDVLLIGGANSSNKYNGTYNVRNRISKDVEFYWYDGGYLTYDYPDKFEFFYNLYKNSYKRIRKMSLDKTLFISNELQYNFICKHIRNAKSSIYIECQYFHTFDKYMSNEIGIELSKRLNKAIKNKDSFLLTIITNSINHDEYEINHITTVISYVCLLKFRSLIDCDDDTFNQYVTCKMPKIESKIIIHNKCWIFDESIGLYTTGNLSDRSFYNTGDIEIAVIVRKGISELIQCILTNQKQIPLFKYDFKYPSNTGYKMIDNAKYVKNVYLILLKLSTPLLSLSSSYNLDISSVLGLKFNKL
jgi:phosphatidylserine/phosphatidylglycerophosphate/cardiolipin synthase-like enzyme